MQRAREDLGAHGLAVAAITYDSPETLEDFAERKGIDYPLLADPTSETIRRFGLLDPDASRNNIPSGAAGGVAYPGYFVLDRKGVVRERFVDGGYNDRRTASGVAGALFPELLSRASRPLEAQHVALALSQSDPEVAPGNRLALAVELALPPGVHVYAPGARGGYRPVELALEPSPELALAPVQYPPAEKLRVEALGEEIPVYAGKLLLRAEVVPLVGAELMRRLQASPDHRATVAVKGVLRYQACDERECFPPCEVPVAWEIAVHALDLERTDPALRKPAK